jgi:hypothetical protein
MSRAIGPLVRRLLADERAESELCRRIRRRGGGLGDVLDALDAMARDRADGRVSRGSRRARA